MMEFDFEGIKVIATAEMKQINYKDERKGISTRHERVVNVVVYFWNFAINGDLYELAFVKSSLQFFMQAYWKRANKEGAKIKFEKVLCRKDKLYGHQSLCFDARQKANEYSLHISYQSGGRTLNEVYLDGQEVVMLDIAIGKAISWLAPGTIERTSTSS